MFNNQPMGNPSSLFGNLLGNNAAQSPFQNKAQQPSIFGGNQGTTQPSQPSSIFGGGQTTTQPNQPTGLFGGPATNPNPLGNASLFNTTPQTTNQNTQGLFQSPNASKPMGLFTPTFNSQPTQPNTMLGQGQNIQPANSMFPQQTTQPQTQGLFNQPATIMAPQSQGLFNQPTTMMTPQNQGLFNQSQPNPNQSQLNPIQNQNQGANTLQNNFLMNQNSALQTYYQVEQLKAGIMELNNRINPKNLDFINIDPYCIFKNEKVNQMPGLKPQMIQLMKNFKILKQHVNQIKEKNNELESKALDYSKKVFQKLQKYKECLIQSISQTNLIEHIKKELDSMEKQIFSFFKPLINAYEEKKYYNFSDPDQFSLEIAQEVLKRVNVLNNKIDDIIACQDGEESDETYDTIAVLEQLLQYYQNIAVKIRQFSIKYNHIKRVAIEKKKRGSYEDTMKKIQEKVYANLNKEFKGYDLIKEIDSIIERREKKESESENNSTKLNAFK